MDTVEGGDRARAGVELGKDPARFGLSNLRPELTGTPPAVTLKYLMVRPGSRACTPSSSSIRAIEERVHVMPEAGEEVLAFPDTQARQLAGVSMRRLRYWEQVGLVVPSIKRRLSEHNTVRLYSYQDLLALLVVSALRTERDMSLQKIRRIVKHLRSRGYQAPLRELKFATVGREIYFQHPDGIWEGDLRPDQVVIYEVILLDPLRLRIDSAARRSAGDAGRVEKRRGVHASAPVFAGTRIRVATVQRYLQQGYLTDAILEAFPDLKVEDVDEARRQLAAAS
jgi:DNA-binding transcriptional MerR regulator